MLCLCVYVCPLAVAILMCTLFTDMEIEIEWINNEANNNNQKRSGGIMKNFTKLITMASQQRHHQYQKNSSIDEHSCCCYFKIVHWKLQQVGNIIWTNSDERKDAFDITRIYTKHVYILAHFSQILTDCIKGDAVFFSFLSTQFCFEKIHYTNWNTHTHTVSVINLDLSS